MSSTAGSSVFFLLSILVICLLVLLLLRYYLPLRTTPAYLLVPVFLAIALPASIILLVPIDLASSAGTDTGGSRGIWLPERVLLVEWRICYWLTFMLTWAILPLLGEYVDSGYREPKARLLYSLHQNGRYQLMVLTSAVVGGVYFFWQSGFHVTSLKALVMALAYAWGLILAIYLMGHGLVALPRRLWRNASISGRLKRLQSHAPGVHEKLNEATEKLEEYEQQVLLLQQRKNGTAREFKDWIDELAETSPDPEIRISSSANTRSSPTIPAVITERYLADLARKLKRARHKKMRFVDEWNRLVQRATETRLILDSTTSKRLEFGKASPNAFFLDRYSFLTPYTRYHLHTNVIPSLYYTSGVLLGLASVSIIWSEIVKALDPKLSIVGLTVVHHPRSDRGQIGFAGQAIAGMWLLYMVAAALFSITEVKVWGNRALVRRGTYGESACWYSLQVAKLTVPLAYNFITFVPPSIYKQTTFYAFLGKLINLTPLGSGFSNFFPIFILVPVCATLFGLYAKIKNTFGFGGGVMDEDEDDANPNGLGTGGWREGRALIERETSSHNGSTLRLATRDNSPAPSAYRDDPTGEPSQPASRVIGSAPRPQARAPRERRERGRQPVNLPNEEEGGFFGDFAHRVKNTFETTFEGVQRPRWMGGEEDGAGRGIGSGGAAASGDEEGFSFLKLFGGGQGRVRL
ncbi:hypothetical protein M501DRAFT_1020488 [Patellaria atrata CBS 101060]|uniref:Uncharacterized protein n=1 Tax=Patellaria atrata CBS 101060 TaxID=1346257 RepID=A0A9P4VM07_9PEZI|nr:hypothetical protein M501DRAFT_1020488 [Patellaria atrata CBS 101060]